MKTLIKALLGASMLLPVAAHAQQDDRRERHGEMRGQRGDRGSRLESRAPAQARPQSEPQSQAQSQPQVQARAEVPIASRPPAQFSGERGADRGVQAQAGARWQGQQRDVGGDMRDQRRSAYRQNPGQQFGGNDRGNYRPDNGAAFQRDQADHRDDRGDVRRDYRGSDRQRQRWDRDRNGSGRNDSGYGDRFDSGNYVRGYGQREGWNRGWRNDTRYDWNRYRNGNSGLYRLPRYYAPNGWGNGYRRFSIGITLSSVLWNQDYWIDDPWSYRLPEAYGPYRWVRYYDDALLVDIRSGQVVDTVYGIFY